MHRIKKFSYKFTNLQQSQIEVEDNHGFEAPFIVYKIRKLKQSRLNNLYNHLMIKISFSPSLASQKLSKIPAQFFNTVKKHLKCASSHCFMILKHLQDVTNEHTDCTRLETAIHLLYSWLSISFIYLTEIC